MVAGLEKRANGHERAEIEINVNLASMGPYYLSKLTNLSTGGAFIQHPNPEAVGTKLSITFQLPNCDHVIVAKAEVAWKYVQNGPTSNNATGMGIAFIDIRMEDIQQIANYIKNILNPDLDTGEIQPIRLPQENNSA